MAYGKRLSLDTKKRLALKYGMEEEDAKRWYAKYRALANGAGQSGVGCDLTFAQYLKLAHKARLTTPDQVGRSVGDYQMGRVGDVGPYAVGNCRFILAETNQREKVLNGGSLTGAMKTADKIRGRTKETHEGVRRQADSLRGRTKENDESVARRAVAQSRALRGRTKETDAGYATTSYKLAREFVLRSPSGDIHRGRGMAEFCRDKGLSPGGMSSVLSGKRESYRGWTGRYAE